MYYRLCMWAHVMIVLYYFNPDNVYSFPFKIRFLFGWFLVKYINGDELWWSIDDNVWCQKREEEVQNYPKIDVTYAQPLKSIVYDEVLQCMAMLKHGYVEDIIRSVREILEPDLNALNQKLIYFTIDSALKKIYFSSTQHYILLSRYFCNYFFSGILRPTSCLIYWQNLVLISQLHLVTEHIYSLTTVSLIMTILQRDFFSGDANNLSCAERILMRLLLLVRYSYRKESFNVCILFYVAEL